MNSYQIRFLKQSILGQKVKISDSKEVIKRCVELADRDMWSGGRFICEEFNKPEKNDRVSYICNLLENHGYNYKKIDKRTVCKALFWECDTTKVLEVNGRKRYFKPYGLAQKIVNMTFKYLYIFREHIDKEIDFSVCECPVDSIILDKLGRSEKWTNITIDEYNQIRECIEKALNDVRYCALKSEIGALAFDDNWVNDGK